MDTELIKRVAENHKHIIVVEEGIKKGGFGESVETFILESGIDADVQVWQLMTGLWNRVTWLCLGKK